MPDKNKGVEILSTVSETFEKQYLKVRRKENRVYSDAEVRELPDTFFYNLHRQEWEIRKKSLSRLFQYLKKRNKTARVLDLGCGNGWLSGNLAKLPHLEIVGLDVNRFELEQAARVFDYPNLRFVYGNIFEDILPFSSFDYIILASAIQYFPNLPQLINRCRQFLAQGGEIHIIDSPLYNEKEIEDARERTRMYYQSIGCEEMAEKYFHHLQTDINAFDFSFLYRPGGFFKKLSGGQDSTFPWVRIIN
ncbi:MAG: class I SAM-dependent methyltransferase [Bacteroidia bacterium]|nr:class I SAM-dependent methyltransferase [Bacteroidia bacterium]